MRIGLTIFYIEVFVITQAVIFLYVLPRIVKSKMRIKIQINLEHVYMRLEVNSNGFENSNLFRKSFHLHGNFTTANFEILNPFQKLFRLHTNVTAANF